MPQVIAMMTPFPYSIDVDATLAAAMELMRAHHIRHLPVVESGVLRGVISDRDIRGALGPDAHAAEKHSVRNAFHDDAYTVEAHTPLDEVAQTMAERHIGSAIVTKAGKLVGVFTTTDACVALARVLRERFPPPLPGTAAA
jgi:acetoin utilization protein AcuB